MSEQEKTVDLIDRLRSRLQQAEAIAEEAEVIAKEALREWDYASVYKGDYLRKKHGDVERIDELRAKLASALGEGRT